MFFPVDTDPFRIAALTSPTDPRHVDKPPSFVFTAVPHQRPAPFRETTPAPGELFLWRYRTEWQAISRGDPRACVSQAEYQWARHYPNPAMAKRYLVGCAALRHVLSTMFGCPPLQLEFGRQREGRLELLRPATSEPIELHLAYAGVWLIIAASAMRMGIGSIVPGPGLTRPDLPTVTDRVADMRRAARHDSVCALIGRSIANREIDFDPRESRSSSVALDDGTRCHVIDLPMPGRICSAIALAQPVQNVYASGWTRS